MINEIQPILEHLIGTYTVGAMTMSGLGGLDYGYFARFILFMYSLHFAYSLLKLIVIKLFGGVKI